MSVPKFAVVLLAGTAILLLSARTAFCDEGPAKSAQAAGDKLAWDDGPPGPPHDGDRPPPPNRDRRNARPGDDRQPPGPPRDGDRDRPPPPDRDRRNARPGDDHQPPGPPRTATAIVRPHAMAKVLTRVPGMIISRRGRRAMVTAIGNRRATARGALVPIVSLRRDHPAASAWIGSRWRGPIPKCTNC